jgi:predicted house-cleaning noncanonical NTP pyrophosphatase (MazG superfamily)
MANAAKKLQEVREQIEERARREGALLLQQLRTFAQAQQSEEETLQLAYEEKKRSRNSSKP